MFIRASTLRTLPPISSRYGPLSRFSLHYTTNGVCRNPLYRTKALALNGNFKSSSNSTILVSSFIYFGYISLANTQSNITSCKASRPDKEKDEFEYEWDDFMMKSMSPNEDDDDEDDEVEDEEDDGHDDQNDGDKDKNEGKEDPLDDEGSYENGKIDSESDPYENLPEEDDPTTCTICLINRQGPCRPMWRKFERCMKDNSSVEGEGKDAENKNESTSLGEKCDKYMLPWITCLQKFRNRYTLISNNFFQNEMIAEIENGIDKDEKILLDNFDVKSIVQIGNEWSKADPSREISDKEDVPLVEGVVSINLWDADQSRPIEIAFVKDQDGTLLGYEQFFEFKKSLKGNNGTDHHVSTGKIGGCTFHANPVTTKSIQIFALYRDQESEASGDHDSDDDADLNRKGQDGPKETRADGSRKQGLFYSKLLAMEEIPIEGQHSVAQVSDETTNKGRETDVKDNGSDKES